MLFNMGLMDRRTFVQRALAASGFGLAAGNRFAFGANAAVGEVLPPWQPGMLDIHHINTGRGNAALMMCPDATSVLIDAGASNSAKQYLNAARPDESRRAGEWIGRYVARQLAVARRSELDYAVMTHLHPDHVGEVTAGSPLSATGQYKLTGISDVAESVRILRLIDRAFPDYTYPMAPSDPSASNYMAYARSAAARGTSVERVRVGRTDQVHLLHDAAGYGAFAVRMLAGNGEVWTGRGDAAAMHFPASAVEPPTENMCSIAMKVSYGRFAYFTGGDLSCDTSYGRAPWRDIESAVAKACGPVSVATVDHHGYYDAGGPEAVRALRPRAWILQTWHATHPAISVLANLYSTELYDGPREVFSVGLKQEAALTTARFSDRFRSRAGHVLVRVPPPGDSFSVMVLDDADEQGRVMASFGPYPA